MQTRGCRLPIIFVFTSTTVDKCCVSKFVFTHFIVNKTATRFVSTSTTVDKCCPHICLRLVKCRQEFNELMVMVTLAMINLFVYTLTTEDKCCVRKFVFSCYIEDKAACASLTADNFLSGIG